MSFTSRLFIAVVLFISVAPVLAQSPENTYLKKRLQALYEDGRSPVPQSQYAHVHWFEATGKYIVPCSITFPDAPETITMPTSSGKEKQFRPFAFLTFNFEGAEHTLTLYEYLPPPNMPIQTPTLFLPFRDATNGGETYGGGRYIDIPRESVMLGQIRLDFNEAYNPLCVYSDGFNCPIPPKENTLSFPVRAGEKMYTGTYQDR